MPVDLSAIPLPISVKEHFINEHYDLVYVDGYIRGALPILKLATSPSLVHHHVVTDLMSEPSIRGKEVVDLATKVLFVSNFATRFSQTGNTEQNSKMDTFLNCIDIDVFQNIDRKKVRNDLRQTLGIAENDIVVLWVGRIVPQKGALELIQGFNRVNDNHIKLVVVGGATYSSGKTTSYVNKCIDEARNNSNIVMTGYVSYSEMPKYYLMADIGTLISIYDEACGLVGIESMAAGLPLIATDRGGIPEYVSDDCCIRVREGKNFIGDITNAIVSLSNDREMRKRIGANCLRRSMQFSSEKYFERFTEICEDVLNSY